MREIRRAPPGLVGAGGSRPSSRVSTAVRAKDADGATAGGSSPGGSTGGAGGDDEATPGLIFVVGLHPRDSSVKSDGSVGRGALEREMIVRCPDVAELHRWLAEGNQVLSTAPSYSQLLDATTRSRGSVPDEPPQREGSFVTGSL